MKRFLLAVLVAAFGLAACTSEPDIKAPRLTLPPATGQMPELVPLSTTAQCAAGGEDLEGKFTSSAQMRQYLECILPAVEQWIDVTYTEMPHPSSYTFVPVGHTGQEPNGGCDYDAGTLKYCFASHAVYFGESAVWEQYSEFGDAAPAVIAAHEVTHHFQVMSQMSMEEDPKYENQADCGAGAFMAWARKQGYLDVEDDIVDLAGALAAAGQAEGPGRTHGTQQERLESFDLAYLSQSAEPMEACIALVPEVPIITAGTG